MRLPHGENSSLHEAKCVSDAAAKLGEHNFFQANVTLQTHLSSIHLLARTHTRVRWAVNFRVAGITLPSLVALHFVGSLLDGSF